VRQVALESGFVVLALSRLETAVLQEQPFRWACIDQLFPAHDAAALAASFPADHYMTIPVQDVECPYSYEARSFMKLGRCTVSYPEGLTPAWHRLGQLLASPAYRSAMGRLTGLDLADAPMEVNLYQYGPEGWLKPHCDIGDKLVTHVLYFNQRWQPADGGCLRILASSDMAATVAEITPTLGRSAVIVRGEKSWHAVTRMRRGCERSRRSMSVIFYVAGFAETMWPFDGEAACLHNYRPPESAGLLSRIRARLSR
jgi:SM-20-related protein